MRRILRDNGVYVADKLPTDGVTGGYTAGSKPFKVTRPPILSAIAMAATAPGGNYDGTNSYLPAFDQPASLAAFAPTIADNGPGGSLPAGEYQIFWTLSNSGASAAAASLPSPLSNKITLVAGHSLLVTNLPNPIPAGGINFYIVPLATGGLNAQGFALYVAAGNPGPYIVGGGSPGNGISPIFVNTDTGEITFGFPPLGGTLALTYNSARFADAQVLDALTEGMNLLWPEIWNPVVNTTQVVVAPTQFEYALQSFFGDQRTVILDIEYSPPSGFTRFQRTSLWRQVEDTATPLLIFTEVPPPGSIVRITYAQTFSSLASIPSQASHLPIYYAVARLLADQETMRSRADDVQALTQESAAPAGTALSAAAYWIERFNEQLTKLALDIPARRSVQDRAVEALGLSEFWTHVA